MQARTNRTDQIDFVVSQGVPQPKSMHLNRFLDSTSPINFIMYVIVMFRYAQNRPKNERLDSL